jgi:DNA polymerase-3 subunit alpha
MWNEITGFEHPHRHSDYSLLDGFATVEEYAEYSKTVNQQYLCISDHGMMGAVPRQIAACDKHSLNPVFACELFTNPLQVAMTTPEERKKFVQELPEDFRARYRKNNHLLAIAYTNEGYKNLVRLSSWGYLFGMGGQPQRPRVNYDVLERHKAGLIFTSCCYASEIGWTFDTLGPEAAEDKLVQMMARFGENYRLEIMMLDFVKQKPYNEFIIKMHLKYHIPIILSQDCHYCKKEDSDMQRLMLMQQTGRTIQEIEKIVAEGGDVFELQDTQLYMKGEEDLNQFWYDRYRTNIDLDIFKAAKRGSVDLCNKAKGVQIDRSNKLPQIPDADAKLKEAMIQGAKKRNLPLDRKYISRLQEEYDLICRKGFASYFLIQQQFTDTARREAERILGYKASNPVGPGRGSAVGALLCYCLRITDVDPIRHDLLFSRFLSEARGGKTPLYRAPKNIDPVPYPEAA